MNRPPQTAIRVTAEQLQPFVETLTRAAGLAADKARLLAELLTANELRGVRSHGVQQAAAYARLLRDGQLNPDPQLTVERETPLSLIVDGDGGLGYFPAHAGTLRAIDKAKAVGAAVMLTRNHGHFGAAGLYSRLTLAHDLICFVTSGHQLHLAPGDALSRAAGGSPMSFSAPAGAEASLLLDFGVMHDFYREEIVVAVNEMAPGLVLRSIGLGEVCQAWGGLLSGLSIDAARPRWTWPGANQGSLVFAFRIDLFMEPAAFKAEMDEYVRRVRRLAPLAGFDQSFMPGGVEAAREAEYRRAGIPLGDEQRQRLEKVAGELGVGVPW
ncbi:MAG: Ldh family oxidoreductase [Gemmatimonadota bacterium]